MRELVDSSESISEPFSDSSSGEFFFRYGRFLQCAKFLDGEIDHLAHGVRSGAGVDGHHAGIGIRRELADTRDRQGLASREYSGTGAKTSATQKIVEHGNAKAVFVPSGTEGTPMQKMDLLEVALRLQMDRSLCAWRAVVRGGPVGFMWRTRAERDPSPARG